MLCLYGAGGHAKVVLEIAEELNIPINGIIDENIAIKSLLDYEVNTIQPQEDTESVSFLSIGSNAIRKKLAERYSQKKFATLVHPKAFVSRRSILGTGTVVMAGVSINSSVIIGRHTIVNTNASVDHDCLISDYVHIAPNASLAGNVTVGEGAFIGIGACVKQGINIGKWAIIGAGAVVVTDIPDFSTAIGNPAKF